MGRGAVDKAADQVGAVVAKGKNPTTAAYDLVHSINGQKGVSRDLAKQALVGISNGAAISRDRASMGGNLDAAQKAEARLQSANNIYAQL